MTKQLVGAVLALGGLLALSACGNGTSPIGGSAVSHHTPDVVPAVAPVGLRAHSTHRASARVLAADEARRVIEALPVAPHTHRTSHGKRYGLGGPSTEPVASELVDRGRVWVGKGTVADAKAYIASHLPPGFTANGSGEVTGPDGVESTEIDYDLGGRWQQPRAYTPMGVELTFTQTGDDVGIRADAQTTWLHSRTPAQHLPLDVTGVSISTVPHPDYRRSKQHRIHVTRGPVAARRLVRALDHLPVAPSGFFNCPLQLVDDQTVLVLHYAGHDRRVTYEPTGCGGVTIPGGPGLESDGAFQHAYQRAVRGR